MTSKRISWGMAAITLIAALVLPGCEVTPSDGSGSDRDNAIPLFEDSFKSGEVAKDSEQWFSFNANNAGTYYIHIIFGTLEYLNVRVFNLAGSPVGGEANLWERGSAWYFSREITGTGAYRIRVRPYYSSDSGTYRIAFNNSATPPSH